MKKSLTIITLALLFTIGLGAQNKPGREKWLQDAGFGMFIHWSMDVQLGTVISHSLVGASDEYADRYINELPETFNPYHYDPDRIAYLARISGMKYMVFTTKHHSGFCMWDTRTSDFNIMNTPYSKDIVRQYVDACRKQGLAVGFYYSPEDFHFLYTEDQIIRRRNIEDIPEETKTKYIALVKAQCSELLRNYGKVDMMFFDGGGNFLMEPLKPFCWEIQPDLLITRGEIPTPEQHILDKPSESVWEACMTMGTQWQFKPTNESYKTAADIIRTLVETRARGGALLMNVGPDAFGELPFEQERNLTELAAWNFVNMEALSHVRPWVVTNEGEIWYTHNRETNTLYAILFGQENWKRGERREFLLTSVRAGKDTRISILGQSDKVVEYKPDIDPQSRFEQKKDALHISVVRAQRIYNNHKWPNPIVVRLEGIEAVSDYNVKHK